MIADSRAALTRRIADNYGTFESLRDMVLRTTEELVRHNVEAHQTMPDASRDLLEELLRHGVVIREEHGHAICEVNGKRYLSGGWLEELAYLAARESADEAFYGQNIGWSVKGYNGENEVDLIARRGGIMGFVSCKALRSVLDISDRKQRNRLMDAVHEADNLADHFGRPGERVAIMVTTDLHDEMRGLPRYSALMGKAAVLDVRIISLEELGWDRLVTAVSELWQERSELGVAR
ncbi:MAG: hypothetical protein HC855_16915 [Rhizobiales bacterium]|nr:hypothetical protein [Hyphomicrobiales bacterium]